MKNILDMLEAFRANKKLFKSVKTSLFGDTKSLLAIISKAMKGKTYVITRKNGNYEIVKIHRIDYKATENQTGFYVTIRQGFVSADFSELEPGTNSVLRNVDFTTTRLFKTEETEEFLAEIKDGAEAYMIESFLKRIISMKNLKDISVYELTDKEMSSVYRYHQGVNETINKRLEKVLEDFREEHIKSMNETLFKDMGIELQ